MQAAVLIKRGSSFNIEIHDVPQPTPGKGEVLVRIHAATINPIDIEIQHGQYGLLVRRAQRRRPVVTGLELSGQVQSAGERFHIRDDVIGYVDLMQGGMTHAEYAVVPERILTRKPTNLSHEDAVTLPIGALTSVIALQKHAAVTPQSRILINGASGGVGLYAIQVAKLSGAHVAAVAGSAGLALAKQLGADTIKNYRTDEVLEHGELYDVIFDVANTLSFHQARPFLTPRGTYITTNPFKDLGGLVRALFSRKRSPYLMVTSSATPDFERVSQMAAAQMLRPVVDRVFGLHQIQEAFEHVTNGSKRGRVVLKMI